MHSSDYESQLKRCVWSCVDVIHEFMDCSTLREISCISLVHRGSSTAIFSYNFKPYHPIELHNFVSCIHSYNMDHNRGGKGRTSRPNYLDKLSSLKLYSIHINYSGTSCPDLYNHHCLLTCRSLKVLDAEICYNLYRAWNFFNVKFAVNELTIRSDHTQIMPTGVGEMFSNVTSLNVSTSLTYKILGIIPSHKLTIGGYCSSMNPVFSESLESLTIGLMSVSHPDLLSGMIHLKELIIRKTNLKSGYINLPNGLNRLQLPLQLLNQKQELPPDLDWLCISNFEGLQQIDPKYFKNSSIKELHLIGLSSRWWKEFEPPSTLQSIRMDNFCNVGVVCERMRKLFKYQLAYVILGLKSIDTQKDRFIDLWICNNKRGSPQIWKENKEIKDYARYEWFVFGIDEFETINLDRVDWTDPVSIRKFETKL
jgi:hypothetical protein